MISDSYHAELVGEEGVDLGQQVEQRAVGHRPVASAPDPEGCRTLARVSNWGAAGEDEVGVGAGLDWGWGAVFPPPLFCWRGPCPGDVGGRTTVDGPQFT